MTRDWLNEVREVFLVRHAESEKNLEDRHGGPGRALTPLGMRQVGNIGEFLRENGCSATTRIYCSSLEQVLATAVGLGKELGVKVNLDKRLRPLDMGTLGGLSRSEAARLFPEPAARLEDWRAGRLNIEDLELPGGEEFAAFWARGEDFVASALGAADTSERNVVVGTRSILILLLNILLKDSVLRGKEYSVFEFSNGGVTLVRSHGIGRGELAFLDRTDFL